MEQSMDDNKLIISWLNDALAMENAQVQVLEHRINNTKDFPDLQAMERQHLEETRRHAQMVEQRLTQLGEKPSSVKSLFGTIYGAIQAPITGFGRDEVVKNCIVDHSAERFEVASYTALIEAATQLGDMETAMVCQANMIQDDAMGARLLQTLPMVVRTQVSKMSGAPAGRAAAGQQPIPPEMTQPGTQPEAGTSPG
jgi:ferritin-like metal-binding protein YciE